FSVWTRGKLLADVWLLRMFLLWLVLQSPWIAASAIPSYTNQHKGLAMSYISSSFGGLLLALILLPRLGLKGLPIAFIVAELAACYHFVVRDACRIVGDPYGRFARKLWLGLTAVMASAFCATWVVHLAPGLGTFPRWVISGCVSIAVVVLGTCVFWFREGERAFVRNKLELSLKTFERPLPSPPVNSI
ncbi:MAG TPA: polysaccharide biosynthesis C-terminal domain-containing protein, partial [Candidatus Acidoferrum sp.]|nr:polysaccharide biosynthesis C-terminal domain-containing protein [Candidatus Acidoferrum sp.]